MPTEIPSLPIRPGVLSPTEAQREVFRQINARLMEPWGEEECVRCISDVGIGARWLCACYRAAGWGVDTGDRLDAPGHGSWPCAPYLIFTRPTTACAVQAADQFPGGGA